jgi:hypothetical protein
MRMAQRTRTNNKAIPDFAAAVASGWPCFHLGLLMPGFGPEFEQFESLLSIFKASSRCMKREMDFFSAARLR